MNYKAGDTVALTLCPVWVGENPAEPTPMSGLFELVEFQGIEPSAYAWTAGWWIVPAGPVDEAQPNYWVDWDDLHSQIYPADYGRRLVEDRMMEFAAEDDEARERLGIS